VLRKLWSRKVKDIVLKSWGVKEIIEQKSNGYRGEELGC
jgi:hypothetical protein